MPFENSAKTVSQSSHVQTFIKTSHLTHTNSCQHLASILPAPCQHHASSLHTTASTSLPSKCQAFTDRFQHSAASTSPAAYRQQPVSRCRQNDCQHSAASTSPAAYGQQCWVSVRPELGQCQARVGSASGQSWVSVKLELGQCEARVSLVQYRVESRGACPTGSQPASVVRRGEARSGVVRRGQAWSGEHGQRGQCTDRAVTGGVDGWRAARLTVPPSNCRTVAARYPCVTGT